MIQKQLIMMATKVRSLLRLNGIVKIMKGQNPHIYMSTKTKISECEENKCQQASNCIKKYQGL